MFKRNKKETIGVLQDDKGISYLLVRDSARQKVMLTHNGDAIDPWHINRLRLNVSDTDASLLYLFLFEYLQSYTNINLCMQVTKFPWSILSEIWNSKIGNQLFVKETILKYQDVINQKDFIASLNDEQQLIFFTQNDFRTKESMSPYREMCKTMVAKEIAYRLSEEGMQTFGEDEFGRWTSSIQHLFDEFYDSEDIHVSVALAVEIVEGELTDQKKQIASVREKIQETDHLYQKAPLSERFQLEEKQMGLLTEEKELVQEIDHLVEKRDRIQSSFLTGKPVL